MTDDYEGPPLHAPSWSLVAVEMVTLERAEALYREGGMQAVLDAVRRESDRLLVRGLMGRNFFEGSADDVQ